VLRVCVPHLLSVGLRVRLLQRDTVKLTVEVADTEGQRVGLVLTVGVEEVEPQGVALEEPEALGLAVMLGLGEEVGVALGQRLADPVAQLEGVMVPEVVPVREGVREVESVRVTDLVTLRVRVGHIETETEVVKQLVADWEGEPVTEGERETLLQAEREGWEAVTLELGDLDRLEQPELLWEGEGECEGLELRETVVERLTVALRLREGEDEAERDRVTDPVRHSVGEAVPERQSDGVGEREPEGVPERQSDGVLDMVLIKEAEAQSVGVGVPERHRDGVLDTVLEGVPERRDGVAELERHRVSVSEVEEHGVTVAVLERHRVTVAVLERHRVTVALAVQDGELV
jgi:hypothetical protein